MAEDVFGEVAREWVDAQRKFAKFAARYRADEKFRARADRDPAGALRRAGLPVGEGEKVRFVDVDPDERIVLIPRREPEWAAMATQQDSCIGTKGSLGTAGCIATAAPSTLGTIYCFACFFTFGSYSAGSPKEPTEPAPTDPEPSEPEGPEDTGLPDLR